MVEFLGFCTKCRAQRQIQNGEVFKTKTGRDAQRGPCPVCGTRIVRMGAPKP